MSVRSTDTLVLALGVLASPELWTLVAFALAVLAAGREPWRAIQ